MAYRRSPCILLLLGNTAMHMTSDYIYPFRSERVSRCSSTGGQGRDGRKPNNEKMLLVSRSRQLSQKPESIPFPQNSP